MPQAVLKGVCPRCLVKVAFCAPAALAESAPPAPAPGLAAPSAGSAHKEGGGRVGRYKLLQQIGEGGCGVVYLAEQEEPVRRRVAVKIIKLGMDTRQVVARFEAERQALAMMDHPNIARVLDAGATETGRPYFVMELVGGTKITEYCDQHRLSTGERLKLFIQVCHAIQHAHQKGVIHRDIKPSNILVTLHDDAPVPKVIDFGIAKAIQHPLTDKTLYTCFEQFLGTPAYTSPEQAGQSGLDVDTRSDIYSLGVLLYELLTGYTPFDPRQSAKAGMDEVLRRIRDEEPLRPSTRLGTLGRSELTTTAQCRRLVPPRLISLLRGDLDWIVMKCLEKDRTRRYATANALALDLERHLTHQPVTAAAPSLPYQLAKFVRRNRIATAFLSLLLAGAAVSTWEAVRADRARAVAQRHEAEARENLWASYLTTARSSRLSGQPGRRFAALDAAAKAAAIRPALELRSEAASALALVDVRPIRELPTPLPLPDRVILDPKSELYACAEESGNLSVRRVSDGREVLSSRGQGRPFFFRTRFSQNGRFLAAQVGFSHQSRHVQVWELPRGRPLLEQPLFVDCDAFDFHPQLPLVAAVNALGQVHVFDLESGRKWSWPAGIPMPNSLCFRPDANELVLSDPDQGIRFHDTQSGRLRTTIPQAGLVSAGCSADGRWLYAYGSSGQVWLWDLSRGGILDFVFEAHHDLIWNACLDPQGDLLVTQSWDGSTALWSLGSHSLVLRWPAMESPVFFSADGLRLGSCVTGRTGRILEVARAPECRVLPGSTTPSDCNGAFTPDGRWVVVPSPNGLECWDVRKPLRVWLQPAEKPRCVAFQPDGRKMIVLDATGAREWSWVADAETGLPRLEAPRSLPVSPPFSHAEYSSDGGVLVVCQLQGLCVLRDQSAEPALLPMPDCNFAAVSPDGRWAAACPWAGFDSDVRVWELSTRREVLRLAKSQAALQFTRDGRCLVLQTRDFVECLEVGTWRSVSRVARSYGTRKVVLSSDSRWAALQEASQHIQLCEIPTLQPILTLEADRELPISFSPDDALLLTRRSNGQFWLWDLRRIRQELGPLGLGW
jgi:eukaryotic-like serine/threonine-protein kinase